MNSCVLGSISGDWRPNRVLRFSQHFKENPFFSDKVLTKEFKYVPPPAAANEKPDEEGITASMLDFSWERDVEPKARIF